MMGANQRTAQDTEVLKTYTVKRLLELHGTYHLMQTVCEPGSALFDDAHTYLLLVEAEVYRRTAYQEALRIVLADQRQNWDPEDLSDAQHLQHVLNTLTVDQLDDDSDTYAAYALILDHHS